MTPLRFYLPLYFSVLEGLFRNRLREKKTANKHAIDIILLISAKMLFHLSHSGLIPSETL